MLIFIKSFPKIQIIFVVTLFFSISCTRERSDVLDNEKFIEIYARLLIISELDISKENQDKLIGELYRDYTVSGAEIDSSIAYFNRDPQKWAGILEKTRDRIQEIRTEMIKEEKEPQPIEKPLYAPAIPDTNRKESRRRRLRNKPSRDKLHLREKKREVRP